MQKRKSPLICFLACLAFTLSVFTIPGLAQEKTEAAGKLLKEIAGDYEFEYQGEYIVFIFTLENGNLLGAPEGEAAEILEPVDGEEMTFLGYSPDGAEYRFKFIKDEDGEISKCLCSVPAMGLEIEGAKIKG
jgi:hypothetical protein